MQCLAIKSSSLERLKRGYPWVYASDLAGGQLSQKRTLLPGSLVSLMHARSSFAIAFYNPHSTIVCRVVSLSPTTTINVDFFRERLLNALKRRERFFDIPYYRLIHAESDYLPGLIIDRFHDTFVCQTNTAGMERLKPLWLEALIDLFTPQRIIFKDDTPSRKREGLPCLIHAPLGNLEEEIVILENGLHYGSHPAGQKTSWFYDHRANRHWIASRAQRKTVLDLYAYQGAFGLLAAFRGARHVTLADRSAPALQIGSQTAQRHGLSCCDFVQEESFTILEKFIHQNKTFDIVIADPPAFIKQAHHEAAGLQGYQKLARLASQVVSPGGILLIASCSHHATSATFRQAVEKGMQKSNKTFQLLRKAGADRDHPIHPQLPETHYLKALSYRVV